MDHGQFYSALGLAWVLCCAAVMLVAWLIRNKSQQEKLNMIHQERLKAIEKGAPMPEMPEIASSRLEITPIQLNPRWPLGLGAICIMGGLGVTVAFLLSGDPGFNAMWSLGFIGVFFGFGLTLYYFLTRSRES